MPTGYISHISCTANFGFINSSELGMGRIYFHTINCKKSYKYINNGDKVSFVCNLNIDKKMEATEVFFIQNPDLEKLKIDFKNGNSLDGFLKKRGNYYYIKDRETYIYIPLMINLYEINKEQVYKDNLNALINYKIVVFDLNNRIKAINIDRQLLPECKLLVKGNKTEGEVSSTVKGGYLVKIYENILGFLPKSLADKNGATLENGEKINVTCIETGEDLENVILDLTKNIEDDISFEIEKEKFIRSLKPGDKFSGKIEYTRAFGVFISFGITQGLLHISNIVDESIILSKTSRKQFFAILEEVFCKEKDIDVIIKNNINNVVSLTWDKTLERNKNLYKDIYDKYKALK